MQVRRRTLWWTAALCIGIFCAIAGVTHSALGRRAWRAATGSNSCPFSASGASLAEQDKAYRAAALSLRGALTARGRPALKFTLGQTTRTDFLRWATSVGGRCDTQAQALAVECSSLPLTALADGVTQATGTTLFADFDLRDTLRALRLVARVATPQEAIAIFERARQVVEHDAGPTTRSRGEPSAEWLSRAAFSQVGREYRFADYYANIDATHMGGLGYYTITQTYQVL